VRVVGKLTIVTDNEWYVSLLAGIVSRSNLFASLDLSKVGKAGKGADVKVVASRLLTLY
jgi:hypothetical protein